MGQGTGQMRFSKADAAHENDVGFVFEEGNMVSHPARSVPQQIRLHRASISMQQFHQTRFVRKTFCQRLIERCQTWWRKAKG